MLEIDEISQDDDKGSDFDGIGLEHLAEDSFDEDFGGSTDDEDGNGNGDSEASSKPENVRRRLNSRQKGRKLFKKSKKARNVNLKI